MTKTKLLKAAALLVAGLFLGWLIFGGTTSTSSHADHDRLTPEEMDQHVMETHTDEEGNIVYTCSMHPSVREAEPGNCPICGMDLVPVSGAAKQMEPDDYSMMMTQASMQLANIQTTPVIRKIPTKVLDLPGRITVDERRITTITTHFEGRILDARVNFTGAPIRKGEPMATIYSPDLISAQRELIEAEKQKERNPRLYESARQKFRLWEFTQEQIDGIIERGDVQRGLEILSPVDGYVLSRNIADQQHVSVGTVIFKVADLSNLWVMLEAYEEDLGWISVGDSLQFSGRNNPGEVFTTTVSYIDPVIDPQKRTVGIRADIQNPDRDLKPDMLVRSRLTSEMDEEKLMVPASAVLWTGPRSLVYVQDLSADTPRFEVKEVELGPRTGDYYVIEEGLEEGQVVVFNGAFRIDSEMQLADRFSMMNREPGTGRGAPSMPGMNMDGHNHSEAAPGTIEGIPDEFRDQLTEVVNAYIRGKNAFIGSDLEKASSEYEIFIRELVEIGDHGVSGDGHKLWANSYSELNRSASQITKAGDIAEAREAFQLLSDELIAAIQLVGVEGVIYHQYCPMEEASWLSRGEMVKNPYTPEAMPDCGEIVDRLE
ncbi:MAG: efflux RND transporter periplasmic adaptor subunit [Bacteroidetes bacterium]|nr:efflux RND transporter periplasmic adaptor subunit [Bacteroidota bacterium]